MAVVNKVIAAVMATAQSHVIRALVGTFILVGTTTSSLAQVDGSLAPIFVEENEPETFFLLGDIDGRTAFNFKRAVAKYGPPSELVLKSIGGLVHEGLLLALEVKELELKTVVSEYCMSACFYVFMAGIEREVDGQLGVHQMNSDSGDFASGQVAIADMIDVLNQLNVNPEILVLMLQTPADRMHVFTSEEIRRFGLATHLNANTAADQGRRAGASEPNNLLGAAIDFVSSHNRLWSQENAIALAEVRSTYDERVDFYDNDWSREQVMEEKATFVRRWPVRDYHFRPQPGASYCSSNASCTVVGEVDWYAHSPERSATSRGTAEMEIGLLYRGGYFRIVRESGRVVARH